MERLLDLAEEARRQSAAPDAYFHGGLLRAVDDFAASIAGRFRLPNGGATRDVLEAYARDHAIPVG